MRTGVYFMNVMILIDNIYKLANEKGPVNKVEFAETVLEWIFTGTSAAYAGFNGVVLYKRFRAAFRAGIQAEAAISRVGVINNLYNNAGQIAEKLGYLIAGLMAIKSSFYGVNELSQEKYLEAVESFAEAAMNTAMGLGSAMASMPKVTVYISNLTGIPKVAVRAWGFRFARVGGWMTIAFLAWDFSKHGLTGTMGLKDIYNTVLKNIRENKSTLMYKAYTDIDKLLSKIEDHSHKYTGVYWNYLSWRAVVPLKVLQFQQKSIEQLVRIAFIKEIQHPLFRADSSKKPEMQVEDILEFYDRCIMASKDGKFDSGLTYFEVAEKLQDGDFTPNAANIEDERWRDGVYYIPKGIEGINMVEKLLREINLPNTDYDIA